MASFVAGAGVAVAFLALGVGVVAGGRESGDLDRERVCITSKHAQSKTSRKSSQKFDSCSQHSLGQLPERADESESVGSNLRTPDWNISSPKATQVHRKQPRVSNQKATSVHRTQHRVAKHDRFVVAISGPLSGPSGSPRSPAEPHPPSLAWVETPLPLGPLPPPPGPLNAKHSKRARGAVFNGTHSPVRYSQSSPIRARHRPGLHRPPASIAPGADLPSGPGCTRQVQCRWG